MISSISILHEKFTNRSIKSIDETQTNNITQYQSGPGSNDNEVDSPHCRAAELEPHHDTIESHTQDNFLLGEWQSLIPPKKI